MAKLSDAIRDYNYRVHTFGEDYAYTYAIQQAEQWQGHSTSSAEQSVEDVARAADLYDKTPFDINREEHIIHKSMPRQIHALIGYQPTVREIEEERALAGLLGIFGL